MNAITKTRRGAPRNPATAALVAGLLPIGRNATAEKEVLSFTTKEEYLAVRSELRRLVRDQAIKTREIRRAIGQAIGLGRFLRGNGNAFESKQPVVPMLDTLAGRLIFSSKLKALSIEGRYLQEVASGARERAKVLRAEQLATSEGQKA